MGCEVCAVTFWNGVINTRGAKLTSSRQKIGGGDSRIRRLLRATVCRPMQEGKSVFEVPS